MRKNLYANEYYDTKLNYKAKKSLREDEKPLAFEQYQRADIIFLLYKCFSVEFLILLVILVRLFTILALFAATLRR